MVNQEDSIAHVLGVMLSEFVGNETATRNYLSSEHDARVYERVAALLAYASTEALVEVKRDNPSAWYTLVRYSELHRALIVARHDRMCLI